MIPFRRHRSGQALIIVVFGMVALIGMTGLAVDGGSIYADRRHAQNAADTATMAAALTRIRNPPPAPWSTAHDAGMLRAADNGYDNNLTSNVVNVYLCSDPDASCVLPDPEPFDDVDLDGVHDFTEDFTDTNGNGAYDSNSPDLFVQATITSHVPTYFARVIGIPELTNNVQAIAVAVPGSPTPWYNGNALVATMPGCQGGGWPHDPFVVDGNSLSLVNGSGVFVNSNCQPPPANNDAFIASNGTSMDASGGICVVGSANVGAGAVMNPPVDDYCGTQINENAYTLPSVDDGSCTSDGQIYDLGSGLFVASPGRYSGSPFPPPPMSSSGTLRLQRGIYCIEDGITFGAGMSVTSDTNGNGEIGEDDEDEGVLLYVPGGNITFNAGTNVQIGAMNLIGTDPGIRGYLIYMPPTNNEPIKISGNNNSAFVGTILAPSSFITLEGGGAGTSLELECQIIGYSIRVTGGGTIDINYFQGKVGTTWTNPVLVPYK